MKDTTYPLLVVEDNDEYFEMLCWALKPMTVDRLLEDIKIVESLLV